MKTSICFGGLVSHFLTQVGVELSWDAPISRETTLMDGEYLVRNHLVVECLSDDKFLYEYMNDDMEATRIYLPLTDFIALEKRSIIFNVPKRFHVPFDQSSRVTTDGINEDISRVSEFMDYTPPSFDDYEEELGSAMSHEERLNLHEKVLRESYSKHNTAIKAFKSLAKPFLVMYKTLKTCSATKDVMQSVINGEAQPMDDDEEGSDEEEEEEDDEEEEQDRYRIALREKAQGKRPAR